MTILVLGIMQFFCDINKNLKAKFYHMWDPGTKYSNGGLWSSFYQFQSLLMSKSFKNSGLICQLFSWAATLAFTKCNTREQCHTHFSTSPLLWPGQICRHDLPFHGCGEAGTGDPESWSGTSLHYGSSYDHTNSQESVNQARKQFFTQKGRTIAGPQNPTKAALIQHTKRAVY